MQISRRSPLARVIVLCAALLAAAAPASAQGRRFEVTVAPPAHTGALTGRLIVVVSRDAKAEPRLGISPQGPAIFGVDLDQLQPDGTAVVSDSAIGYPMAHLADLPSGDYSIQAIVDVYEQLHRADGHTIWAHMNDGTTEFLQFASGNLYSDAQRVHIGADGTFRLTLTHVVPPAPRPTDTEWLKHVTIQSQKLTKFWGRPIYIHATVLLPRGYAGHPTTYYPSVYSLGHGTAPFSFSPDSARSARAAAAATEVRRGAHINPVSGVETGYDFYKSWTSDGFPRVIAITLEQQTPYFADSYSVNSANNGPYGDAIIEEVMPYLEQHFRIIPKPYARQVEGASTSGWQTLALTLQHPDFFGDAWVLQPDPIDFRHYQQTNIYEDDNAFSLPLGPFTSLERPFQRTTTGQVVLTTRQLSRFEAVLGSHGRSGFQLEAWEAVYGPIGTDGYPVPLWDKLTGKIDHGVATFMRDHGFDLREYAQHNWPTLGPKLAGKLHFFAGDMDNFYLNLAVYDFEDFAKTSANPHSDATFTYGRPMKGHGWHSYTWAEMIRMMADAIQKGAPRGENTSTWRY